MNITEFKKEIKGITTGNKKNNPIEHTEYILSGNSDMTSYKKIIVVVPSHNKDFEIVTKQNKTFAYIVTSLDLLNDQNILNKVSSVYGLNYLFTMDKKEIGTYNLLSEKHVSYLELKEFNIVDDLLKLYKSKGKYYEYLAKNELINASQAELKEYLVKHGYFEIVRNIYLDYRKSFENFISTFGYNPYSYNLKLTK